MKYAYFLLFTILFAFQLNSSATGFGGYCPECLVKNMDKDLAQLQNVVKVGIGESMYIINSDEKCAEGYVEGTKNLRWMSSPILIIKQCLKESTLIKKYYTHLDGHCAKNFVEGRWFKTFLIATYYKECLEEDNLPEQYETYVKEDCAEDYVQGRLFKREKVGRSFLYGYKQCLKKSALPVKYHTTISCAEGYVKGKRFSGTTAFHEYAECTKK